MVWTLPLVLLAAAHDAAPTRSAIRQGPHHLSAWTLSYDVPDRGLLPTTLVIARRGHVIRRIEGDSFIWSWYFLPDAKHVAYQTGPLHFSLTCVLADLRTGRKAESIDCFAVDQARLPPWAQALDK